MTDRQTRDTPDAREYAASQRRDAQKLDAANQKPTTIELGKGERGHTGRLPIANRAKVDRVPKAARGHKVHHQPIQSGKDQIAIKSGSKMTIILEDIIIQCTIVGIRQRAPSRLVDRLDRYQRDIQDDPCFPASDIGEACSPNDQAKPTSHGPLPRGPMDHPTTKPAESCVAPDNAAAPGCDEPACASGPECVVVGKDEQQWSR